MSDPQDTSAVQHETVHEDEIDEISEAQPFDPGDYPIRIHDPEIELVVGMSYD